MDDIDVTKVEKKQIKTIVINKSYVELQTSNQHNIVISMDINYTKCV